MGSLWWWYCLLLLEGMGRGVWHGTVKTVIIKWGLCSRGFSAGIILWKKGRSCSVLLRDVKKRGKNRDGAQCLTRGNSNDMALIEYCSYCWRGGGKWGVKESFLF